MQLSWNVRAVIAAFAMIIMPWLLHAQQAQIRATHLGVDAPDLDVYIDSDTASFYGLRYGNASSVSSLTPGNAHVRVIEHNKLSPVFYDATLDLLANRRLNVLIFGTPGDLEIKTISLPTNAPSISGDSAAMRFVQASPDAGTVSFKIRDSYGGTTSVNGVAYKSNTTFQTIPRGSTVIEVYVDGTATPILKVRNDFGGGSRSTIFLTDLKSGGSGLKLQLMNELPLSAQQPIRVLQAPTARLRAVHAVPDGPAIDIYADNTAEVSDLAFRDASQLISSPEGQHSIGVTAAGQPLGTAIINLNLTLNADSIYTAVAVGTLSTSPSLLMLTRSALMGVSNDSVLVRFVNAYPGANSISISMFTTGDPVPLNNIAFRTATPYVRIRRGDIAVNAIETGGGPLAGATGELEGGSIATILVTGSGNDIQFNVLDDARTEAQIPMGTLTGVASGALRAVHLVPDGPEVDIFINDKADNPVTLGFREASGLGEPISEGTANVKIAPTGTGIGAAVVNRDVQVVGNAIVTAFAVGSLSTLSLDVVTMTTLESDIPQQGQAAIRLLHASPDAGAVDIEFTPSSGQPQKYTNIAFKGTVNYVIVPPGTTMAKVFPAGSQTPMLSVQGTTPVNMMLTAILSGTVAGGNLGMNILVDSDTSSQLPMVLMTAVVTTSVEAGHTGAVRMDISPNPVRGMARIGYSQDHFGAVRLSLYDQLGRCVATAQPEARDAGSYAMTFSTSMLPAGVYNAVLTGTDGTPMGSEKLVVVR